MKYTDPAGRTNYIFYDEESFSKQAEAESKRIPVTDNEETKMIPVKTEQEFLEEWNKMENATDGNLAYFPITYALRISNEGKKEYVQKYGKKPKGFIKVK